MRLPFWLGTSLGLLALGCSAGSATSPLAPSNTPPGGLSLGGIAAVNGNLTSALGIYTIDVDRQNLTATSHLQPVRTGEKNSDLYGLSIGNFMNAGTFHIDSLSVNSTTITINYTVTHPFGAPTDPAGTPSAVNRADLGIAGTVLFLADVPSATANTYFDEGANGKVVANTALVMNADAYQQPAGLLNLGTGPLANTFPFRELVDETKGSPTVIGSRIDPVSGFAISNGGNVTGNFGNDGWTRAELGIANPFNKWTGYGVLHQGQAATNTVVFSQAALAGAGTFTLDVVIIAKYNDPRAGASATAKKANRLPPATANALTSMAYRMPHGALDCAPIKFEGEGGSFLANNISASTLRFHVVDWDARATPSSQADLSLDPVITTVPQGEEGLPSLAVCIPGVLGDATVTAAIDPTDILDNDTPFGGDAAADSGVPGDGLFFSKSITKTVTSGQSLGTYTGLVRAIDPEEALSGGALTIPLDGTTLAPLGSNKPHNITYQAFSVLMNNGCAPVLAYGGSNITTSNGPGTNGTNSPLQNRAPMDFATFPRTSFVPEGGAVLQSYINSGPSANFSLMSIATGQTTTTFTPISAFATPPGRAHQIECDQTGRVIFATVGPAYPATAIPECVGDPVDLYAGGAASAVPNFFWFDPVPGGPLPSTFNTVNTGTVVPIALTTDQPGNVYAIDQNNRLRQYLKSNNYAENTNAPYPKDLTAILGGTPATIKVQDFICNFRNNNFYILKQPNTPNVYIVEVDCDLSTSTTSATFYLDSGWNVGADIAIDQWDSSGNVLATQGEAQIAVVGMGWGPGIQIFNSQLFNTSGQSITFGYTDDSMAYLLNNAVVFNCPSGPDQRAVAPPAAGFANNWQ